MQKITNIYHILIDRFSGNITDKPNGNRFMGGNLNGITGHLDYIRNLGCDTVLLTPFCTSASYHGYHTIDYYSVDPHFGTVGDLRRLIENVHNRDMKIVADFVPNHCSKYHPFFVDALNNVDSPYRKWFYFKGKSKAYKHFMQYDELPKFNLDNRQTAQYMIDVAKYWSAFGIDGFRIDHAIGPSFSFLKRLVNEVKEVFPDIFFIGEVWNFGLERKFYQSVTLKNKFLKYITGTIQKNLQKDYIGILDGVFNFYLFDLILDTIRKKERCVGNKKLTGKVNNYLREYPPGFLLISFLDNHDMNRFLFYCNQDKDILLDALEFIASLNAPVSLYYGTETLMSNQTTIYDGAAYSDLKVREPFEQKANSIIPEISEIFRKRL